MKPTQSINSSEIISQVSRNTKYGQLRIKISTNTLVAGYDNDQFHMNP